MTPKIGGAAKAWHATETALREDFGQRGTPREVGLDLTPRLRSKAGFPKDWQLAETSVKSERQGEATGSTSNEPEFIPV